MTRIKRALISVSDKTGIIEFAQMLLKRNVEILSTGGTAKLFRENGLSVTDVSEYTGFPEMMDGRVKTLHPKIHGALLALRDNKEHMNAAEKNDIIPIDMVVVNLYPFVKTIESNCTFEEAIENIDIGGPAMLRSAAKNFRSVTVVSDPEDYSLIEKEMVSGDGCISYETNFRLAVKVYESTSKYDGKISDYLKSQLK
ncbi:MAG: IMP cyclohydrolase [Spirochaetes bacterium]|nr:IMP cyclohydrolase [Spirochaetota bacterium]